MKSRLVLTLLAGVIVASGLAGPAISSAGNAANAVESSAASTSNEQCSPVLNTDGVQQWVGSAPDELVALADDVQSLLNEHTGDSAGVAYCSDYSGVEAFIQPGAKDLRAKVTLIADRFPGTKLFLRNSPMSLDQLLIEQNRVLRVAKLRGLPVNGSGPDIRSGGLMLGVDLGAKGPDALPAVAAAVEQVLASPVPLRFRASRASGDSMTRRADASPYSMGAEITSSSATCSLGVPILVGGVHRVLTAGHCTGSTWTNNGNHVGTTYTTAYPGNADVYGDWQLVGGSLYGLSVYNGSVTSPAVLSISGATYGSRPVGSQLCASGRTTGQTCRYFVIGNYRVEDIDGVGRGHMVELHHDGDLNGVEDSNGWNDGDSGGPCYFASGAGVNVDGIVTGWIDWFFTSGMSYYCTQLSGVRAWNSSASVG